MRIRGKKNNSTPPGQKWLQNVLNLGQSQHFHVKQSRCRGSNRQLIESQTCNVFRYIFMCVIPVKEIIPSIVSIRPPVLINHLSTLHNFFFNFFLAKCQFNPFSINVSLLYPQKGSENRRFWEYRSGTLVGTGLMGGGCILCSHSVV